MADFSYVCRECILRAARLAYHGYARLTGRRFRCRALAGEVPGSIFVNSDMTVSCNCQDLDGTGQLGSLRDESFEQVFAGPRAAHFRRRLARGKLPISRCAACFFLEAVDARTATSSVEQFRLPRGLGIENTSHCNLSCRICCRRTVGRTRGKRRTLRLPDIEKLAHTLRDLDAQQCSYYNLGEPFLSSTIRRELQILREHNPGLKIFVSTNGLPLCNRSKREAALLADHIVFSIHGVSTEMVRRYQRGGDFGRAYGNMKDLVALRNARGRGAPVIVWKYVVFRWNDHPRHVDRAIDLAEAAGVDCLQLTFARRPITAVTWRFHFSPFYRALAPRQGRFRNVWLRRPKEVSELSQPSASQVEAAQHDTVALV